MANITGTAILFLVVCFVALFGMSIMQGMSSDVNVTAHPEVKSTAAAVDNSGSTLFMYISYGALAIGAFAAVKVFGLI